MIEINHGKGLGRSTETEVPYPTHRRFQKAESSHLVSHSVANRHNLGRQTKLSVPYSALAVGLSPVMLEVLDTSLGNPSSEAESKTSCGVTPQQSSALGQVLWPYSGVGPCKGVRPSAIRSRPIFDSPESNSSVSDDDTQPSSSHPIRQPGPGPRRAANLADPKPGTTGLPPGGQV